jgi:adenine-specific DNA methylase
MTESASAIHSVLREFDSAEVYAGVVAETRSRQSHLPPVSVYRWWARRAETVTGALVDAVAADRPGERLLIADPFAGGGVIALSALLRDHQVYAQDVNPWATTGLAAMLTLPSPPELETMRSQLQESIKPLLEAAYETELRDGTIAAVAHTLRVATAPCPNCSSKLRLFPRALVSLTRRVDVGGDRGFAACPAGHLNKGPANKRHACETCGRYIRPGAQYTTGRRVKCVTCSWTGSLENLGGNGFEWEPVLIERYGGGRRELGLPTPRELRAAACSSWGPKLSLPAIADGAEARVLRRHGMLWWHDLYPARQRVVIEALLEACARVEDTQMRRALEVAVIGSTEMAGLVSRWDSRYLKPYEAVANHRFNFTTLSAEPNVWGASGSGRGTVDRRIGMMVKAAVWLEEQMGRQLRVRGPVSAEVRRTKPSRNVDAIVVSGSSARLAVPSDSLDAVISDPPYHDDVQYGELSDLFRAWSGSTTGKLPGDAIVHGGDTTVSGRSYTAVLTAVFSEVRRALKPGGHFVLSYANRDPRAWVALFTALQDAKFEVAGYEVVHSENEQDHAKSGRRACALDVIIDAVPASSRKVLQHCPALSSKDDEQQFCHLAGSWSLRVGRLSDGWEGRLKEELMNSAFLQR